MRELTREIKLEIDGKEYTFLMKKFTAFEGGRTVVFLAKKLVPQIETIIKLFKAAKVDENAEEKDLKEVTDQRFKMIIPEIGKLLEMISEDELVDLEKRCLQSVSVMLPAGLHRVFTGSSFGLEELEYDTFACLTLTLHVLMFNSESFFGESSLKSAIAKFSTMLQDA